MIEIKLSKAAMIEIKLSKAELNLIFDYLEHDVYCDKCCSLGHSLKLVNGLLSKVLTVKENPDEHLCNDPVKAGCDKTT